MAPARLAGRTVVVTGGSGAIGEAAAAALLAAGANVAVWARNEVKNAATAARLAGGSETLLVLECDVGDPAAVAAAVARTTEAFGAIDGLVSAAASTGRPATFMRAGFDTIEAHVVENLRATLVPVEAVVASMTANGGGSVVLVSSLAARIGQPMAHGYAAAKGALLAVVPGLARELGRHHIRVNAVLPGWIESPMTERVAQVPALRGKVDDRLPLGRWGTPEDVAATIEFLVSPAAAYVTGQALVVDGGYSAG